jgi:hypothetical protein
MKYIVCARTTDDKIENPPNPPIVQPTVIVELSQPLDSLREAELWIEKQDRDHAELIRASHIIPGREFDVGIQGVE